MDMLTTRNMAIGAALVALVYILWRRRKETFPKDTYGDLIIKTDLYDAIYHKLVGNDQFMLKADKRDANRAYVYVAYVSGDGKQSVEAKTVQINKAGDVGAVANGAYWIRIENMDMSTGRGKVAIYQLKKKIVSNVSKPLM